MAACRKQLWMAGCCQSLRRNHIEVDVYIYMIIYICIIVYIRIVNTHEYTIELRLDQVVL